MICAAGEEGEELRGHRGHLAKEIGFFERVKKRCAPCVTLQLVEVTLIGLPAAELKLSLEIDPGKVTDQRLLIGCADWQTRYSIKTSSSASISLPTTSALAMS